MIRLTFKHSYDPKSLHREFLRAGAKPHLYTYRPRADVWTLVMVDVTEGKIVRQVLDRLSSDYDEVVVASRFERVEAVE